MQKKITPPSQLLRSCPSFGSILQHSFSNVQFFGSWVSFDSSLLSLLHAMPKNRRRFRHRWQFYHRQPAALNFFSLNFLQQTSDQTSSPKTHRPPPYSVVTARCPRAQGPQALPPPFAAKSGKNTDHHGPEVPPKGPTFLFERSFDFC